MDVFVGSISPCAFRLAPKGFAHCNGQILNIYQNTALFSLLATNYGGDGKTTFALPDLRGRLPIHPSPSHEYPGIEEGNENLTLTLANLPAHGHPVRVGDSAGQITPVDHFPGGWGPYAQGTPDVPMAAGAISPAGEGRPVDLMKPSLAMNYVIALTGIFPRRS